MMVMVQFREGRRCNWMNGYGCSLVLKLYEVQKHCISSLELLKEMVETWKNYLSDLDLLCSRCKNKCNVCAFSFISVVE